MVLATPIFYPVVLKLGFDLVWFGVFLQIVVMIGVIIPPVAINVFIVKNIAKVPLSVVYAGTLPFLIGSGLLRISNIAVSPNCPFPAFRLRPVEGNSGLVIFPSPMETGVIIPSERGRCSQVPQLQTAGLLDCGFSWTRIECLHTFGTPDRKVPRMAPLVRNLRFRSRQISHRNFSAIFPFGKATRNPLVFCGFLA